MKLRASWALAGALCPALASLGCAGDRTHADSAADMSPDDLDSLTNEQLAARLYQLTREQRVRETFLLQIPPWLAQSPDVRERLKKMVREDELSGEVTSDYLAFYDRPTLLAAVRFFQSDAGRIYAVRQQALDMQIAPKERAWAQYNYARAQATPREGQEAPAAGAPTIDAAADTARDRAPGVSEEQASAVHSPLDDSSAAQGTRGEVAHAKETCKKPALKPMPAAEPEELLARLTGRWYACSGSFDAAGQEGPEAAAGIEVTADGRWYLLDAAANGTLVRRPTRDMRDQFSGRVGPDNGNLMFTFDSPTNGMGGFMATLVFSSTAPALDFNQTRMVRVQAN